MPTTSVPRVHTVVAGALYRGAEVLLCHRSATRRWYPDVWDLPGGHVDGHESPRSALVRELREELAVSVSERDLAPLPDAELVDDDLQLSVWRIESWAGDPVNAAPDEHDALGWFPLGDALAQPLAYADYPALLTRLAAQPR